MSQKTARILLWISVVAVCGLIFFFSSQTGEESSETSDRIVRWVLSLLVHDFEAMAPFQQQSLFDTVSLVVRKLAHFSEFALLAFLVRLLMHSYRLRLGGLWAWLAASLYAVTDELHQMSVAARSPSPADVGIDSLGAAAGALLACLALWLLSRRRQQQPTP